jgi:uncharacterized protein
MGVRVRRAVFLVLGIINVALGAAGIILPLLPTTPFLILAAYLFAKSDDRRYRWLMEHPHLGPYIHAFRGKTGLTKAQKIRIGLSISVAMAVSIYFAPILLVKCMLAGGWAFWTIMLVRMKTAEPSTSA